MSGKNYAKLHQRIQGLIARGNKIKAGTPATRIHEWIEAAEECLSLLEDKASLSAFQEIQHSQGRFTPPFEIKVDDDDEAVFSDSAYRPQLIDPRTGEGIADVLLDFRFDLLKQANHVLKLAAVKLEIEGHSLPTLGEQLRAARALTGDTQRFVAKEIGGKCQHKYISEWETGKRIPCFFYEKRIRAYIAKSGHLQTDGTKTTPSDTK